MPILFLWAWGFSRILGEHQSIAQKGVRAIDARNSQPENDSNATKTSVRAPGLSTDEREHPLCDTLALAEICFLFLWGIAELSRDMLQKGGIALICLRETKCQGGGHRIILGSC